MITYCTVISIIIDGVVRSLYWFIIRRNFTAISLLLLFAYAFDSVPIWWIIAVSVPFFESIPASARALRPGLPLAPISWIKGLNYMKKEEDSLMKLGFLALGVKHSLSKKTAYHYPWPTDLCPLAGGIHQSQRQCISFLPLICQGIFWPLVRNECSLYAYLGLPPHKC